MTCSSGYWHYMSPRSAAADSRQLPAESGRLCTNRGPFRSYWWTHCRKSRQVGGPSSTVSWVRAELCFQRKKWNWRTWHVLGLNSEIPMKTRRKKVQVSAGFSPFAPGSFFNHTQKGDPEAQDVEGLLPMSFLLPSTNGSVVADHRRLPEDSWKPSFVRNTYGPYGMKSDFKKRYINFDQFGIVGHCPVHSHWLLNIRFCISYEPHITHKPSNYCCRGCKDFSKISFRVQTTSSQLSWWRAKGPHATTKKL